MDDVKREFYKRKSRLQKAVRLEIPDRVPVFSLNGPEVTLEYAGKDLKTDIFNFRILAETVPKYYRDMMVDGAGATFFRNPKMYSYLGARNFRQNRDGSMQYYDVQGMFESDYEALINSPMKTLIEKILPRIYQSFLLRDKNDFVNLAKGIIAYHENGNELDLIDLSSINTFGVPIISDSLVETPFDFLSDQLRGLTGIVTDMHRRPEQVEAACEVLLPLMVKWGQAGAKRGLSDVPGVFIPLHMPPFLNPGQFERFYWPTFKKMVDAFTRSGHPVSLFLEGNWSEFYDYLQTFNGQVIGFFETGDLKVIKEKLGKSICIAGNYPLGVLKSESTEKCIDIAKEMLDVAAPGGGYIFSTGKVILRKSGVDLEKLKAVHRFIIENGKY
ncbi:uroporphyrinogen decarboxylase family protein [Eubacteriaceae bacterium ES2]|nr:uroporphyrinogen decarboxylase family protein [Eubacteriaceae bacterium ES2]